MMAKRADQARTSKCICFTCQLWSTGKGYLNYSAGKNSEALS